MSEKEAKEMLYTLVANNCRGNDEYIGSYEQAFDIIIDLLEQKDNRIDELEKALIDEEIKNKTKIEELESELYNANCIIDDYIEERKHLNGGINKLMAKRKKWKNRYYKTKAKLYQLKKRCSYDRNR